MDNINIFNKMRRCPWCGKEPTTVREPKLGKSFVVCQNSECVVQPYGTTGYADRDEAIKHWNNPPTTKNRFFTADQVKELLENLFIDDNTIKQVLDEGK